MVARALVLKKVRARFFYAIHLSFQIVRYPFCLYTSLSLWSKLAAMMLRLRGLFTTTRRPASANKTFNFSLEPARTQDYCKPADRYQITALLQSNRIPYAIWLEDVLVAYGSDTQVWELNLLVEHPPSAAEVLYRAGYSLCSPGKRFADDPEFAGKGICVSSPVAEMKTILYSAKDWHFSLKPDIYGLPPLNEFIDSLLDLWLNISLQDYVDRLPFALHISCLITYCYRLEDPQYGPVKSVDYASRLQKEHQELHFEIVSGDPKKKFFTTERHRFHAHLYEEIKLGKRTPQAAQSGRYRVQLSTVDERPSSVGHPED